MDIYEKSQNFGSLRSLFLGVIEIFQKGDGICPPYRSRVE